MHTSTLNKFGGVSLIFGSFLLTAYAVSFSLLLPLSEIKRDYTALIINANWIWIAFVAFIGVLLMIFGFFAVYARMHLEAGSIGF